ncbi:MAG: single-stranded-DNA-specific exonuclease RecJ [Pseudomonadota bacterium]
MAKDIVENGFLAVDASLTGRVWRGPSPDLERRAEALAQDANLPDALARILAARAIRGEDVATFLAPSLKALLPNPRTLRDMEPAAARLNAAIQARDRIAIFADYDVDGGASAAILQSWLKELGLSATIYVPDRIDEGYGPNPPAMSELAQSHDLIICVDCGTLSHDALAAARGADVLVLDHHLGGETLPPALAIVNPNRQDETGDLAHLCAAAVVFLFLVEVVRQRRAAGQTSPDLMALLDLVALATVADVAPLVGVNRAFVRQGLKVMARRDRIGLTALADVAGLNAAPTAYHLGYVLGPRINAGGRIGQADLGARLLTCDSPNEAKAMAERLDHLNRERREIEARITEEAMAQAEARGPEGPLVWAAGDGWHPGVVGIVASRLKEAFNRPAIVIGMADGQGKGSGRSVTGVDLGASIQRLAQEDLLLKGGGHKMAAGLTVSADRLEPAMERLSDLLARQGAARMGSRSLHIDAMLMPGAATVDLIAQLEQAGPFGASAPAPRFAFPDVQILGAKQVGDGHLKLTIGDGLGARLPAIAFRACETPLGAALEQHGGRRFHVAGRLELNHWGGRQSPQLRLEDAAPANPI